MSEKIILELNMYTDGDWRFDLDFCKNHQSRYFDQKLYEYTIDEGEYYTAKIRRVFEPTAVKEIVSFVEHVKAGVYSSNKDNRDSLANFFNDILSDINSVQGTIGIGSGHIGNGNWEGTNYNISSIETDAQEIERIIYKCDGVTLYYPMAIVEFEDCTRNILNTYEGVDSLEKAKIQFEVWENYGYNLILRWIDVYEEGKAKDTILI